MYILLGILIIVEIISGIEVVKSVNRFCSVNRQRLDERANDVDSDIRVYVPSRDRNRSSNSVDIKRMDDKEGIITYKDGKITNEYSKTVLEIMLIMMKNILSETEKDAIRCAIDVLDCNPTTLDF